MTSALDLKFLGPPVVLLGGQSVKFATRKALALFTYLVVENDAQPRERLQATFWPESETHLAQPALRNTLARIKKALRGVDEPLRMDGDRVGFNFSIAFTLDLELVRDAPADLQSTKIAPPAITLLESAADAYRGPFMDGFSLADAPDFDEWLTIQRSIWIRRQALVYEHLSLHQLDSHLIQPAIETVIRWIKLDRLNETAYQRLMRLHFLNNNRSEALRVYEICRHLLVQKMGVEPSSETEEVLEHIRSSSITAPVADSQIEVGEPLHIPFVGRSHEYKGLVRSFHLAQKGEAQVVCVSGESGIGKTRLSDEFLKWAGTEGADILRGCTFETGGRLPYQPIIDALRDRLERENSPDDLLDDAWLVELSRILPELRERYPDLALASSDHSTMRAGLFEAIARLAESLSTRRPLVWLIDDLQWVDEETLKLLHYLAHKWRSSRAPILLLILVSEVSLGHGSALREWMRGLAQDTKVTHFTLSALNAEDLQQLILSLAGENAPGSSEFSAWLTAETAGQPFLLTETLAELEKSGVLVWRQEPSARRLDLLATLANLRSAGDQSLAPAIRDVILARLKWLNQPAAVVLAAAAVIGRNCSFTHLCRVSGIDEQNSLNALDELLSARMILENRNETLPYTITHDRIREIVYAQLSEARRQTFHRRALTALVEAQASFAELAHHALAAKEWQSAFDYSLKAGDEALQICSVPVAAIHYQAARSLLNEKNVDVDTATCQHLYTHLGQACELDCQPGEALAIYDEMQAQASARGSHEMGQAARAARLAALHENQGDSRSPK